METTSVLESIGVEIIGVMSPVSICMFLVVLLVYAISPTTNDPIRTAANLVYLETSSDSNTTKLEGALLNAVVFILLIAVVTFLLVLLYYYNFTSFLKNYMRFSAFFVLASMGGSIFLSIIQRFSIPVDSITCFLLLLNFSVVGVLSVFSGGIPIFVRQIYMVSLGIIVAAWFTKLPEWTTWVLLVALALYDLVAVLAPGGPLKILVELASSRDEELPALVYEARPTVSTNSAGSLGVTNGVLFGGASDSVSVELQPVSSSRRRDPSEVQPNSDYLTVDVGNNEEDDDTLPLVGNANERMTEIRRDSETGCGNFRAIDGEESEIVGEEISPLVEAQNLGNENGRMGHDEILATQGIKLGLGDFVFYSVLVGRAAMYDLMTVYACYLAIISGLGCTLILLSVCHRALPALPISITLGIVFYFLTRLLMEPFVVGTSTNLMMF